MGEIEMGWGLQVILWFQTWRTPLVEAIALLFHYLGSQEFMLVFIPMVYWCIDEAFGRRLTLFFALSVWTNGWLKDLWDRPRPFMISEKVHNIVSEYTYGIPSGHTQHATTLWGSIALKLKRYWVTAAAVAYVILMGIARMVAGVHFPQDVIAGALVGLVLVGLYAWLEKPISTWINKQSLWMQIGAVVAVAGVMLAVHPYLIQPASLEGLDLAMTSGAIFLGGGIGLAIETHYLQFSAGGVAWKKTVRLLLGVAIIMGLRYGLKALFEGLEPNVLFRLLRYGLIGFVAAYGAPWIFVKLKLAEARRP